MSSGAHVKSKTSPFESDLDRDPGIGQSKGAFATGADPDEIEGDNTVEGDVENDPNALGGIGKRGGLGRTNK
jgi:hypothetical protein